VKARFKKGQTKIGTYTVGCIVDTLTGEIVYRDSLINYDVCPAWTIYDQLDLLNDEEEIRQRPGRVLHGHSIKSY